MLYLVCFWCYRTRAGYSRGDQFYASYPAGTELLTDTAKVCDIFFFSMVVYFVCLIFYVLLVWYLNFFGSYIKLHLAIALNQRSGVRLSTASWPSTLIAKGNHLMHIMQWVFRWWTTLCYCIFGSLLWLPSLNFAYFCVLCASWLSLMSFLKIWLLYQWILIQKF